MAPWNQEKLAVDRLENGEERGPGAAALGLVVL
jgi:hypothetical protein